MKVFAAAIAMVLLGLPTLGACQTTARNQGSHPVPPTPAPVNRILAARHFTLTTPFTFDWSKERPKISSGTLVVLEVDRALVVPRNALEPVLYAGGSPVMRLNYGHLSGRVLGIVPDTVDLTTAPFWFGTPELPERVTTDMVVAERAKAEKAGYGRALPAAQLTAARRAPASAKDLATLLRTVGADLILEFSPQEKDLAETWRLRVAKPPPARKVN
jgi:hypothetical protein